MSELLNMLESALLNITSEIKMTGSWGKVEYLQLAETLGCNEAAIKLMLLSSA